MYLNVIWKPIVKPIIIPNRKGNVTRFVAIIQIKQYQATANDNCIFEFMSGQNFSLTVSVTTNGRGLNRYWMIHQDWNESNIAWR